MSIFPFERQNAMQVFTFPENGRVVTENPPCLCWIPPAGKHTYTVTLSDREGNEIYRATTSYNYHVPSVFLEAGEYRLRVQYILFSENDEAEIPEGKLEAVAYFTVTAPAE